MITQSKFISILGILTILMYFSHVFYLLPFLYILQYGLKISLPEYYYGYWIYILFLSIFGTWIGVLLLKRKNDGRKSAIVLSVFVLSIRLLELLKSFPHLTQRLRFIFVVMLKKQPLLVIQNDILLPLLCLVTIIYLTNPTVIREFKPRRQD